MEAPVIPVPIITMSVLEGRVGVVLWERRKGFGSECQNEAEELGQGSWDCLLVYVFAMA